VAAILMWIVTFPFYFAKRRYYGRPNMVIGAALVALVFAGSWAAMGAAIENKQAEIRHTFGE
jgi:hypothetical protein